jgi:hypothetical protein
MCVYVERFKKIGPCENISGSGPSFLINRAGVDGVTKAHVQALTFEPHIS